MNDLTRIDRLINEVDEYKKAIERENTCLYQHFESITGDVQLVRKEGYVLDIDSIRNIYGIVSIGLELTKYLPILKNKVQSIAQCLVSHIIIDKSLTNEIDRVLDQKEM
ncbi:MAG: hypothetical protein IPP49_12190 [Saprospiraceae bacterium]|nr:hypothetical protein [Saprospiraceae bacterium]